MELKQPITIDSSSQNTLLIVPYGIETTNERKYAGSFFAFNRTLWN